MKNEINLLPKKGFKEPKERAKITKGFLLVGVVTLVLFLTWLIPFVILLSLNQQHAQTLSRITQKEGEIKNLNKTESIYKNVINKGKAAQVVSQKQEVFLKNLDTIRKMVDPALTVENISLDDKNVKLTVGTKDIGLILIYLRMLDDEGEKQKIFKILSISSMTATKTSGYEVTIQGMLL